MAPRAVRSVVTLGSPFAAPGASNVRIIWRMLTGENEGRENIEGVTTHIGRGFHAPALWVMADRPAQAEGRWKPFRPGRLVSPWFPRKSCVWCGRDQQLQVRIRSSATPDAVRCCCR